MKKIFDVTGMTCASCAAHVKKATGRLGIANANVDLIAGRLVVETDIADDVIIKAVESAGYGASVHGASVHGTAAKPVGYSRALLIRFLCSLVFLLPLMYFTMGHMIGVPYGALDPHKNPVGFALMQLVLTTPVLFINRAFFIGGAKALAHRSATMDTLVSLGAGVSYVYGLVMLFVISSRMAAGDIAGGAEIASNLFFESAAMILTLVTLGKFLEARSKGKTRGEVEKLLRLKPNTATVLRDGESVVIAADDVVAGDLVVVMPGEYIPCDGVIREGATTLDKSAITGESMPVEAVAGDSITSATLNLTGRIVMCAERVGADSTLARIIELVENAGGSKAPIQKIADKVSAVFVPAVCAIALVTLIVWLALGYCAGHALTMGISVLVISCPCALGLATPVAVMAGTGRAAAYGVLVKNAETLQSIAGVKIFALDKTATVTEGKPRVTRLDVSEGHDREEALCIAACLESTSSHPLAQAIIDAYAEYGKAVPAPERSEYKIGYGVIGVVNGTEYALGSARLADSYGVTVPPAGDAPSVYLVKRGEYIASITVDDEIKPTSPEAINLIRSSGAEVVMLTGDNEAQAKRVAKQVGISEVYCNVLPEDKLRIVEELKLRGKTAMVGDGINDAPALKAADVGIAIGSGTDVAIEAADVVLVRSDLKDVPRARAISRATLANIKQNLFWAFLYNTLGIPLAAGVLFSIGITLNPMIAAGAMACSSLFVVCNALRLTIKKFDDAHLKRKAIAADGDVTVAGGQDKVKQADDKSDDNDKGEDTMKVVLKVSGMSCLHCTARVADALRGVDGVKSAEVNLEKAEAVVKGSFNEEEAIAAVKNAGYECRLA